MKFTLKDICIIYNKHINSIYPKLKPIMPLFLFNSGKKCKRIFTEQEITALLPYLKKPKKPFIINNIDNNIIFLATILNNKIQQ